jgi:hypothetical protein
MGETIARAWKLVVSEAYQEELVSRLEPTIQTLEIIMFCGLRIQLAQCQVPDAVGDVKNFVRWFVYVQIPGFGTVVASTTLTKIRLLSICQIFLLMSA